MRVIKDLKSNGHIAATTGDRVNDAPTVKNADILVSVVITGNDVREEISDMVLTIVYLQ